MRPWQTQNATSKIGSASETWLPASSAPPVRGRCSPPRHPTRVPNIVNGHSSVIANPNQKPDVRHLRVNDSRSFAPSVSGVTGSMRAPVGPWSARGSSRVQARSSRDTPPYGVV